MSFFSFSDFPKANKDYSVAIVVADFNEEITERMLDIAFKTLKKCKINDDQIFIQHVSGSFEIPFAVKKLQSTGNFDGILTLGAIIKGETPHFNYVASECARGIMDRNLFSDTPVVFGVLTCNNIEQTEARIERSADSAKTLIEQMNFADEIDSSNKKE